MNINKSLTTMPKVSVCIPMYNSELYLHESIDSVLSQTFDDFELLIIDDGSTDSSCQIVESYSDPRIRLLHNCHDFIDTSNMLIDNAHGEYIARMDSDDRMLPNRLRMQVEIMDAHPEIDILGGGYVRFGKNGGQFIPVKPLQRLTLSDFVGGNCIANPTVMMRRSSIQKAGVRYEKDFIYAEDFRFWLVAIEKGLCLTNTDAILTEYRSYDGQVSTAHHTEQMAATDHAIRHALQVINGNEHTDSNISTTPTESTNSLTVIIPFLNEGEEVRRTVESIRATVGHDVDIIVINDCSFDGYPYRDKLEKFGVTYIFNNERKGVAASRDLGVSLCHTPYFLLLDAHMRFYNSMWHRCIVERLQTDDRLLLCCQTKVLEKDADGNIVEATEATPHFGAYMPLHKGCYLPDIKWNNKERYPECCEEEIPFVLGAGYATSRRYWQHLHGLAGLRQYGCDEAYISLKVWREGGRCVLLKNVVIGHIYRTEFPYTNSNAACVSNYLLTASLLFPQSLRIRAYAVAASIDRRSYEDAVKDLAKRKADIDKMNAYYHYILTRPCRDILPMHHIAQEDDIKFAEQCSNALPIIASTIAEKISGNGLLHGKIAAAIWLSTYALHTSDVKWRQIAEQLIDEVAVDIANKTVPHNFEEGIYGIGWGLIYMLRHKLVDEKHASILNNIDSLISVSSIIDNGDRSLATGIAVLAAYLAARMQQIGAVTNTNVLAAALPIANKYVDKLADANALYHIMLLNDLVTQGILIDDILPNLAMICDNTHFIPRNPKRWEYSLNGILGATLD